MLCRRQKWAKGAAFKKTPGQPDSEKAFFSFFFFLHLPNSKETFFSTIVASENIAIVLYLPCSRQRTSYVEDRTIDVRTFPFPWDIWFDIFVFGLLSSWVLSSEDSFSVVYIYRAAVTKITFGLVTTDYMRYFCEIKSVSLIWRGDISNRLRDTQNFFSAIKKLIRNIQIENP